MSKKFILTLTAVLAFFAIGLSESASVSAANYQAKVNSKRIVAGTRFNVSLLNRVNTQVEGLGGAFDAALIENIKVDEVVMLPVGTALRGSIIEYKPAKRLSRGAVIYVKFDHIVTTEGKQLPIKATIGEITNQLWDGGIIANGNYGYAFKKTAKKSKQIIKNSTDWGVRIGEDKMGGYLQYITTPIAAVGGAIGGSFYFIGDTVADLFKKGEEVAIPAGTKFAIILTKDLDVPVNY